MAEDEELSVAELERLHATFGKVTFAHWLGMELVSASRGSAIVRLEISDKFKQAHDVVHGGAIASLLDTATALAILPLLEADEKFTTVDLTISYLRPLTQGAMTAEARVLRTGRRLVAVTADVKDDEGKLAATALSTYLRFR